MGIKGSIAGALVVAAMIAAGCGGGSSSAAGGGEGSKTREVEASKSFPAPSSKNQIPKFGEEADADEREAASSVLEENLQARAAADFGTQCATLSPAAIKEVAELASIQGIGGGGCTKELRARAEPLQQTKSLRENTMTGPIVALRVKGDDGYAIYHGLGGRSYAMPMERKNGEWKVADVLEVGLGSR